VEKHLAHLNPEQLRAATASEGPVLVLAGAGTGKTRVIVARIAHLLARGTAPASVLAVTFTNKAAGEMRARIGAAVGKRKAAGIVAGTFHSFCARLLRAKGQEIGIPPGFSICDQADQLAALKGALRELRIPETSLAPGALQARISLAKNRLQDPERALGEAADDADELAARAWRRYDEALRRTRSLDFDDLLLQTLRLLDERPNVRDALRRRLRHVLVDEFQDTNAPQYEIVRRIAAEHRNLCVVGDDDQSIYGWRGADVSKILHFERDFHDALVVRLETNYRSTAPILEVANRLIRCNPKRHAKELRSALGEGERVQAHRLEDETEEAEFVVHAIQSLVRARRARSGDCAVLFRTQTQPRALEAALRARAVPYVLVGGMSFFDRKEVRDVLAYLKLLANPEDEVSWLRVVNRPPRGVGKASLERVAAFAAEHGIALGAACDRATEIDGVPAVAADALRGLRATLAALGAEEPGRGLVRRIEEVLEVVGYRGEVERCYPDPREREERWAAVQEVLNFAENHVRRTRAPKLASFLQELALSAQETDEADGRDAVTLSTLHSAKGLEFPHVWLVGMEEGLLPHARSVAEGAIEEERRLAYVGVTRAQRSLVLTHAARRARHGAAAVCMPSRFLFEMQGQAPPKGWRAAGAPATDDARRRARGGRGARDPRVRARRARF
jgi:DNA helicase-2/ATP-dependent DNA helicase PcrA